MIPKWIPGFIRRPMYYYLMQYMMDDMEFCLCGCSSLWWNFKRLVRKIFSSRILNYGTYE